jgi:CubicO group peptidase (beta-lactamase class C family)
MKTKLLLLFLFSTFSNVFGQGNFVTDSLDVYITREMSRWKIPGVAIAVIKDGKAVVMKGYGLREEGKPGKVDENTLFQIASNTKLFTATCASLLNSQKRLSFDDKVTKWLKDFRLYDSLATREVTLRDMLCHRIGFLTFQSDMLNWNCNLSRSELIRNMRNVKPYYSFRSKWGYCNMGFVTAGEIIHEASDTSWEDFVRVHLFSPLQMNHTTTSFSLFANDTNSAAAYTVLNDSLVKIPYANVENIGPCASINSCVKDLTNWLLMQLDTGRFGGTTVIPSSAVRDTWRSQMLMNDQNNPLFPMKHFATYGMGLELNDFAGRKVMSHSGGANGFVTQLMFVPEEQLGIIVLTNTDANNLYDALCYQILESYLNLPYRNLSEIYYEDYKENMFAQDSEIKSWKERTAMKPEAALPLDRYSGKYTNEVYGGIEIKKENNKLNIYFSHHPGNIGHLEAYGGNDFVCTYSDITCGIKMISFTAENEKVKSVTLRVNDFIDLMPYEFTKIY